MVAQSGPNARRVALVTGANKGIGKEIARKLGAVEGMTTILGCRNKELGAAAVEELKAAGCKEVIFQHIDLNDPKTMTAAADFIAKEFGVLDILINNAAICFNDPTLYGKCAYTPFEKQAGITVNTNFFGTLGVTEALLPLLKKSTSPRIVNVASAAGRLSILRSQEKKSMFTSPNLQGSQLSDLMRQFVRDVEDGSHTNKGWPNTCYGTSKLGIIALTKVLARDERGMMVNSVDPGYCATDQNANQGYISAEEGARTPFWLACLGADKFVSGKHFYEQAEINW